MDGKSRDYFERKIRGLIREMEEEINSIEFQIEESGWEPDIDYRRQVDELRLGLKEAEKAVKETAASSDATWKIRYEEVEGNLKNLGNQLKSFRNRSRGFLLE